MKYDIGHGTFYVGDCFDVMATLPDASADMVLCDLPYGTTACAWDAVLPFEKLWREYWRVGRAGAVVALTASQPFTSAVVMSAPKDFRTEWVWEKNRGSNFAATRYVPMKEHESVLVFSKGRSTYNPIYQPRAEGGKSRAGYVINPSNTGKRDAYNGIVAKDVRNIDPDMRVPRSVQKFNTEVGLHPTQKPVALFEYLIRTYTNEGDLVLDNTAGSGTTAIAAENAGRRWVCIEKDEGYAEKAIARIRKHVGVDDISDLI